MKIKVKVSTSHPELSNLLLRQTPGRTGIWGHCEFHVNQHIDDCDWWFICHHSALKEDQYAICDPDHIVFISMEPHEYGPKNFYQQFAHVVACDPEMQHQSIQRINGITWWAGINVDFRQGHRFSPLVNQDYDSLCGLAPVTPKRDRISIITSTNCHFPGHHRRLEFIERLMSSPLAHRIDLYGGGHNPIPDKLDALLPYKYHIALENSQIPHYWTEKIADPLLGYCLPFYYGCPNISDCFPKGSYVPIDIESEATIAMIERAIEEDLHTLRLDAIIAARKLVLNDYNIFELMTSIAAKPATRFHHCILKHPGSFKPTSMQRAVAKIGRIVLRIPR